LGKVTWDPTTDGTITLVLLKGPETNAIAQYAIIENYPNTGSFIWSPKDDLEPSSGDTGYGIQLIVDATGQYQYTTQFGISNDHYSPGSYGTSSSSASSAATSSSSTSSISSGWSSILSTGYAAPTGGHPHGSNGTHAHPTGWSHNTTTKAHPTGTVTKSTLLVSSSAPISTSYAPASTSAASAPLPTNAGSSVTASFVGLVFAAGVAVFAL